jgi:hypothetical protein
MNKTKKPFATREDLTGSGMQFLIFALFHLPILPAGPRKSIWDYSLGIAFWRWTEPDWSIFGSSGICADISSILRQFCVTSPENY